MTSKVALLVVFNHRFDRNLDRIRELYKDRFSNIFFLMPFYDGHDLDVISVSYASNCFQGYFFQAYEKLKEMDFDYWLAIGDDLLLNPSVNESNVSDMLGVGVTDSYIPSMGRFDENLSWRHARRYLDFTLKSKFIENFKHLPKKDTVNEKLRKFNLEPRGLTFDNVYNVPYPDFSIEQKIAMFGSRYLDDLKRSDSPEELLYGEYPCCFGYSDIFMIGRENLRDFCFLCGVTAASGLFVEIAIPTSLVISAAGKVVTQERHSLRGRPLWGAEVDEVLGPFNNSFDELMLNFPKDKLFLHPVKLSQWK